MKSTRGYFKILVGVLMFFAFQMIVFNEGVYADAVGISPAVIERPNQITELMNKDEGMVWKKEYGAEQLVYSFTLSERSWVVLDLTTTGEINNGGIWGTSYIAGGALKWYRNPSLTSWITESGFVRKANDYNLRYFMYLDAGTYYIKDEWGYDEITYAYIIPNSAVIKDTLVLSKDGKSYTDKVEYTPMLGTTYLINTIVTTDEFGKDSTWENASMNAEDLYTITENGEYTIKAVFVDAEWKDFPVMYSFSIYDIGKKTGSSTESERENDKDVALSETKRSMTVGDKFTLTLENATGSTKWKSSSTKIIKVENGVVTAVGTGTATITATNNGTKYKCKVTVAGEAGLNYTEKTIKIGETLKLKVSGANAVSFTSSKKSVAKVKASGAVVAKKAGKTTIKVKCDNGKTYTCKVTVKK